MPKEIIKILGQSHPGGGVETVLYTVPENRRAIVKVIVFVDGGSNDTINIAAVPDGFNDIPGNPTVIENHIVLGLVVISKQAAQEDSLSGITLNENDDIRIETATGGTIFQCYGVEIEA